MEFAGPLDPLDVGGIAHAIVGTLIQIGIALAITIPLGIVTAVFLNEVGGRFARFVRTIVDAMTALPSIVAGLFVYSAIILLITHQRSGFAAALAITVMMLPIIIRASDVVLRLVAGNLREASYALGASRWRTVWHVVLPTARSGLVTAVILGTARGIGETSPVLLTSGVTAVMNTQPVPGPDDLAAPAGVRLRAVARAEHGRARLRHRRRAAAARARAVRDRPRHRRPRPGRAVAAPAARARQARRSGTPHASSAIDAATPRPPRHGIRSHPPEEPQ